MTITNISYSESHESITNEGLKKWNKIGLEANVAEGEDIHKCHEELKNLVKGMMFGVSTYNELNISPVVEASVYKKTEQYRIQSIIQEINNCTSLDEKNKYGQQIGLLAYEQAAKDNEEVGIAYELKFQQLKNLLSNVSKS